MGEGCRSSTQTSCSSFPSTPITGDPEFEFGSVDKPGTTSPADRLFFNGRLLPHCYPCQTTAGSAGAMIITTTTRESSRSSSCSARTSSCSDVDSDPSCRVLHYYTRANSSKRAVLVTAGSKRWHYITPVPATMLKRDLSSGRKKQAAGDHLQRGTDEKKATGRGGAGEARWRRLFQLLCLACEECHAMEPSKKHDLLAHP